MIIPSLDIYKNKVVRLIKGKLENIIYFGYFKEYIAFYNLLKIKKIHIVLLENIFFLKKSKIKINKKSIYQLGGGIRNLKDIIFFKEKNYKKFVLSSIIFLNKKEFKKILSFFKKKIVISLDCYKNKIAINGWITISSVFFNDIFTYIFDLNIKYIIYTNIEKDGTLIGLFNNDLLFLKKKINLCSFCISGGIKNFNNLKKIYQNFDYILGISLYKFTIKIKEIC